jgi:hypothetical protein
MPISGDRDGRKHGRQTDGAGLAYRESLGQRFPTDHAVRVEAALGDAAVAHHEHDLNLRGARDKAAIGGELDGMQVAMQIQIFAERIESLRQQPRTVQELLSTGGLT